MQTWIKANIGSLKDRMTKAENDIADLNRRMGGLSLVKLTKSEYEAIEIYDPNTLYVVVADPEPTTATTKTTKKRSAKNG